MIHHVRYSNISAYESNDGQSLVRLRDGLVVEAGHFLDRAQALEAVGLSE